MYRVPYSMYQTHYYVLYAIACGVLIAGLAVILHWAGDVFLHESFRERPELARAVGRLLDIGFSLVRGLCRGHVPQLRAIRDARRCGVGGGMEAG